MEQFNPNIQMPKKHFDLLCEVAADNNITAEQYAKQIILSFLSKNFRSELSD
tara:strand:- start:50 stop:205 length:156 start_codon:yes stop_codon:yes gene_type:complete